MNKALCDLLLSRFPFIVPQDLALIDLVMSSCLYTVEDWPESTLQLILKIFGKLTRDSLDHTNDNVARCLTTVNACAFKTDLSWLTEARDRDWHQKHQAAMPTQAGCKVGRATRVRSRGG